MRTILSTLAVASLVVLVPPPLPAQAEPMSPDIAGKLKDIGRVIEVPQTGALFAPLQQTEPYKDVRIERDIKYGSDDRNLLDVFVPEAISGIRPVLMFVHGGGFVRGNKRAPGSPFYDNVMLWASRNGFIGVNMTYRLAPQSPWPAGAEDVSSAIRWVSENIATRGGDPARIYLLGHSAGAVHAASYLAHSRFHGPTGSPLAGAILVSGIYDLTSNQNSDTDRAYFGTDSALYKERSSLTGLAATKLPLMAVMAELDPPNFVQQFTLLRDEFCKGIRGCVRAYVLPQHSHISEAYAINTADDRLTNEILDFIKTGK